MPVSAFHRSPHLGVGALDRLPRFEAAVQVLSHKFFRAAVKVEAIVGPDKAVPLINVNDVSDGQLLGAHRLHDLSGLC